MSKMTVHRIGVKAVAVWMTLGFFILGIFAGVLSTMWVLNSSERENTYFLWYLVVTPAVYAGVGVITALIVCCVYNSLNSIFGSIEFELQERVESPPLPPVQWNSST